ncbi:MAG TPA: class I SAM-dependent methyltransferase [Verrucomicrobiae bacterium]|jgi:tRNA (cmo5U34)-methyltransferase
MNQKSTVTQIRERFDQDVERFSNLETGQSATIDAPLALELIASTAAKLHPQATAILDIGCGAGNYTLKLLSKLSVPAVQPAIDTTLMDLSRPMLDRAVVRVSQATSGLVTAWQGDIRELNLGTGTFDVILAAAVLHHLRDESEWQAVFAKIFQALRPGGSFWISDLIEHSHPHVQALMWERYGDYLKTFKDDAYREAVFAYIAQEDSPRPLLFQLDLLRAVGFQSVEILHKNSCFAAFGAIKAG